MDITNKIDAVTEIGADRIASGGIQPPPKSVKIELTNRCNLRCKFCAVRQRTSFKGQDMDFYFFQKITEDMRISGVEEIGLFYLGESFTAPDLLLKATEWCKKTLQFPYVFLTSNAAMADSSIVSPLMDAGMDSLKWSVNAADKEQYNAITGGSEGQFNKSLLNIRHAWEARNRFPSRKTMLSASSIMYDANQHAKMQALVDEYVKPYVDKHYWLPLYQMGMYADKVKGETGFSPTHGNMGRIDENTKLPNRAPLPCWSAFTEGHVRVDGGLSACCFGSDDRFDMGLLDGSNFMRQWNSVAFQNLRLAQLLTLSEGSKALKGTPCDVCVAY